MYQEFFFMCSSQDKMPSTLAQYPDDFMLFEEPTTPVPTLEPSKAILSPKVAQAKKDILSTYKTLIAGSITFVASLAWHEAFKSFFATDGPFPFLSKWGPWVYAASITFLGATLIHTFQRTQ
jgi:hypothetical protein